MKHLTETLNALRHSLLHFKESLFTDKGVFVDYQQAAVDMPCNRYWRHRPGIHVRRMLHASDFLTDQERLFKALIPPVDYSREYLFFMRCVSGAELPLHYHIGQETLLILEGYAVEEVTGVRLRPIVEVSVIPPFTGHAFRFPVPTFALFRFPILFLE